jgi:hypothetical protein
MATRRVRSTVNNSYVQPLKLRMGRKMVITPSASYNSILFTQNHRAHNPVLSNVRIWAKFNTSTFDGIQMIAWLEDKDKEVTTTASCEFKVYYIDTTNNWNQTLIFTGSGTASGTRWVASPNQAALGSGNILDGERTLMIEANLTRWGEAFKNTVYVNHLGVYDSILRLRSDVEFLEITKKDE